MAKKKNKKSKVSWQTQILLIMCVIAALVFLPSTFLLLVGMIPTPFAIFVDRSRGKNKVMAVGALNLAGCSPFLFELWATEHSFEKSFEIASDPFAIIVMWSAAAVGYLVNWAMTGLVAATMYQRGKSRQKFIKKRQQDLIERWGREVSGEIPLDPEGFPLEQGAKPDASAKK